MPTPQNWLADTQATALDGMNRGREPELIGEQQAHFLRNVSTRGGRIRSRPRFVRRTALPAGLLQGASVFVRLSRILASVGGRIYEIDPLTWARTEKTGVEVNSPKLPRVWFCETSGSLVIQDGQARPFLYDGADFRRAGDGEVPVGRAMAYGNGRLAVAVIDASAVRLGDIRQPAHQSELKFTEAYNLLGGGDFAFPAGVLSLSVLPVMDTGSGQGSLVVGCRGSVHTLKTQITQRDMWAEIGFQTVLLSTRGVVGPNAVVAVNQDLYFRSSDGLRSARTSTADYDAPGLAPLSVEVRHRFDHDTPFLLEDASVAYFDNRLLCTHSPFVYSSRSLAQGLIALNFDALSGRGQKSAPCYDGEWDGLVIAQIFTGVIGGVERCFILGRDLAGDNGLWELLPEVAGPSADDEPTQAIETRMFFGDSPGTLKSARRCDVQFSDIRGGLVARIYYRPEKHPFWVKWDEFAVDAPGPRPWGRQRPQYRSLLSTRTAPDGIDPFTGRLRSVATGFQVRVEWEGYSRLDYLQMFQERVDFPAYADNPAPGLSAGPVTMPADSAEPEFWHRHPVSPLAGIV